MAKQMLSKVHAGLHRAARTSTQISPVWVWKPCRAVRSSRLPLPWLSLLADAP